MHVHMYSTGQPSIHTVESFKQLFSPLKTAAEVKTLFRTLAQQHHPDKGGHASTFKQLQQACEESMSEKKQLAGISFSNIDDNDFAQYFRPGIAYNQYKNYDERPHPGDFSCFGKASSLRDRTSEMHKSLPLNHIAYRNLKSALEYEQSNRTFYWETEEAYVPLNDYKKVWWYGITAGQDRCQWVWSYENEAERDSRKYLEYLKECLQSSISYGGGNKLYDLWNVDFINI